MLTETLPDSDKLTVMVPIFIIIDNNSKITIIMFTIIIVM